jgi:hypothetical protein
MNSYQEIINQEDMEHLLSSITGFHDSMIKEIHIINRGAVLSDHKMVMGHQLDAQLLLQSQWAPYAIELLFVDVFEFTVSDPGDYLGATGLFERITHPIETVRIEMKFDAALKISARRLFHRVRSDCLGHKAYLKSEIPSPEAISARVIEEQWRQCSSCSNTWEEEPNQPYSVCPVCQRLTELRS